MEIKEKINNGKKINLRLLKEEDLDQLMKFYQSIPFEDRRYFKVDVTRKSIVRERLRSILGMNGARVISLQEGKIIAEGELIIAGDDWYGDRGEIRVIIAPNYRRQGVGMLVMRELYCLALKHKLEKIVAKILGPQIPSKRLLEKFAFKEHHMLPKYVVDQDGAKQDMLIMVCNMNDYWKELEAVYCNTDWGRCR